MPDASPIIQEKESFFALPWIGTLLTVLSGLSFLLVCMILPLVGKAAQLTTHAAENSRAFVAVLIVATALAALATWSKIVRRRIDRSPLPFFSIILFGLCVFLLVAHVTGLLRI